ncbi:MAG TPA: phage tail protein, partial [Rhodospirillales bacterium]|nr:phage tail protein [Rhodospirillales bacterium]
MASVSPASLEKAYQKARRRRQPWEPLWRECFAYASPVRGGGLGPEFGPANRLSDRLFDGTAPDAVEQLAASLLAQLTPPWSRWFEIVPGTELDTEGRGRLAPLLEQATRVLLGHFERSNFAVEIHQCYLDLVTVGTATLLFQETAPGAGSAFRFTAVPAAEMSVLADGDGRITEQFRTTSIALAELRERFPSVAMPAGLRDRLDQDPECRVELVEAVRPDGPHFLYAAFVPKEEARSREPLLLAEGRFDRSPFITFRWLKAAGEIYGRSPVMTALPDIKTANKVVELILKNASIAVTGIWLAEDD